MSDGSTSEDNQRHPGGRPSKYDPAFCEVVEAEMGRGLSLGAVAGIIGIARSTINEWMEQHAEFSEAVSRAKAKRLLHWEETALNVAKVGGGPGAATMIVFGLKNMGGDEWSDTTKTEVSGPGGKPIQTEETSARVILASKLARLTVAGSAPSDTGEPD